jgi:ubiquinone/menaquinone biosynthesis C-methylase UbiE
VADYRSELEMTDGLPYQNVFLEAEREGRVLHREDIYRSGPPVDLVSEEILEFVLANVGSSVLDIGCGLGPYVERIEAAGKRCVGIDNDATVVDRAKSLGRDVRLRSAYDLQFPDSSFDSVLMVETLEHLEYYEAALKESARVARQSIVITVPDISVLPQMSKKFLAPWHILEGTHVNFFTPEILRSAIERVARSCDLTKLGPFFEVDGEVMYTHLGAVARL